MLLRLLYSRNDEETPYILLDEDLVNWDEIKRTIKRKDYGPVTRTFSDSFEFCGAMYDKLIDNYRDNGRNAKGKIVVETMTDDWTWNELFACQLDFTTIKVSNNKVSISCMDNSLTSIINAKKSTKYELDNDVVRDANKLLYDRVIRYPGASYTHTTEVEGGIPVYQKIGQVECFSDTSRLYSQLAFLPIEVSERINTDRASLMPVEGGQIDAKNLNEYGEGSANVNYVPRFIVAAQYCIVRLKATFRISYEKNLDFEQRNYSRNTDPMFVILRTTPDRNDPTYVALTSTGVSCKASWRDRQIDVSIDVDIDITQGEGLCMGILTPAFKKVPSSQGGSGSVGTKRDFSVACSQSVPGQGFLRDYKMTIKVEVSDENDLFYDPFDCNVIKPQVMLDALLKKMAGPAANGFINIPENSILDKTLLVPADYLRGVYTPRVTASYKDFCEWMSAVFGYVPYIDDDAMAVTFKHRDSYFSDEVVKVIENATIDTELDYNADFDYSVVEIGYNKQDYEKAYGRDEWRWLTQYSTEQTTNEKKLELISPWRADVYGMEYLSAERRKTSQEDTDDKSDNDVFFVCASLDATDGKYHFVRDGYGIKGDVSNTDTMFNIMYSPYFMAKANERYIASVCETLVYASCEGNSKVTIVEGTSENKVTDNIPLSNALFSTSILSVTTDTYDDINDWQGLVELNFAGHHFECYVSDAEQKPGKDSSTSFKLIAKTMTKC